MSVKAFAYWKNGQYDPNTYNIFTGSDAAVDAEWTVLTVTTPGVLTDGSVVVYAVEYSGATLNTPPPGATASTIIQSGTIIATYGAQPAVPKNVQGGDGVIALANGANNDINAANFVNIINTPTGVFNITGITGGVDGKVVILVNNVGYAMTITNDSSGSAVGNRIYTYGATATTTYGTVTLVYCAPLAHWIVTAFTV